MSPTLPFVTIIMPIRNEAGFIRRSLGAVLAQDYPAGRLEIIIADGMSDDDTRSIITQLAAQQPTTPIRLLDNPAQIVPTGLNAALQLAQGEIIVRVDGHCEIAPDYVRRSVTHLQQQPVAGVGGPLETIGETPLAQTIALAMSSPFGVGNSAFRTVRDKTMLVDTVAFPAYRREVLQQAGPFDDELVRNQDDEYNYRLRKQGLKILLAADVKAKYYSRSGWRSLWRQYFQYGFWKVRVLQKHPAQMRPRQFVPPLFVAGLLGSAGLGLFSRAGRQLLAVVTTLYGVANLGASLWTAGRSSDRHRHLHRLPLVYAILHLSYGLGFLAGLVRFWRRWRET
jgi:succinoglycan biosynthesis protein ExoA